MPKSSSKKQHICTSCLASFSRTEHLLRHQLQHAPSTPFACTFCTRHFGRRDVLIRHWRSCKQRLASGLQIPRLHQHRKGAKKRACDACTRRKRACIGEFPCSACTSGNQQCTFFNDHASIGLSEPLESINDYSDLITEGVAVVSHDIVGGGDAQATAPSFSIWQFPTSTISLNKPSMIWPQKLRFFERFFHGNGLVTCFDCTDNQRHMMAEWNLTWNVSTRFEQLPQISETSQLMGLCFSNTIGLDSTVPASYEVDNVLDSRADPLSIKSREIVLSIKDVLNQASSLLCGLHWTPMLETNCREFFSVYNLRKHLAAFWAVWQPNWPVFHKATFNAAASSATLIAGMAIIGACCTPEGGPRNTATQWFDIVEEWIFNHEHLKTRSLAQDGQHISSQSRLDALRAAYCVILYQSWEGRLASKLRARHVLHPLLIEVCRDLQILKANHGNFDAYIAAGPTWASWKRFILTEELVRTVTYVCLLDSAYATFFNLPPQLMVPELQMEFTCREDLFESNDPDAWFSALLAWVTTGIADSRLRVGEAALLLCQDYIPPHSHECFKQMTTLNYFTVMHALQCLIFNLQFSLPSQVQSSQLQQALVTFRQLLLARPSLYTSFNGLNQHNGFFRHIDEFWILACIVMRSTRLRRTCKINESIEKLLNECDPFEMVRILEIGQT